MENLLKYSSSASDWIDALPLGNGRIGAMVYGRPIDEIISMNEDTLWSGEYKDRRNYSCKSHLDEIRHSIFTEDYKKANRSIIDNVLGDYSFQYMPLGDLQLHLDVSEITDYSRSLDIRNSTSIVHFKSKNTRYDREVFVSFPQQVMAVRQTCSQPGKINMKVRFSSLLFNESYCEGEDLVIQGRCPSFGLPESNPTLNPFIYDEGGIHFEARIRPIIKSGKVKLYNDVIVIEDADEVLLLFAVRTSFKKYNEPMRDYFSCIDDLISASKKSYEEIKEDHILDVTRLFDRVDLQFNDSLPQEIFTDELIKEFTKTGCYAGELTKLKFQMGRYLLIACSRPGTQASNLQGIWSRKLRAKWSSNYTININTQMNYMPALVCNLPECQEPLDRMLKELKEEGEITAREMYGLNGWVAHHNTDLWRLSSPPGKVGEACEKKASVSSVMGHGPVRYGMWPMGGAWLSRHIWEKYIHTKDIEYLSEMYPVMKGAAEFMLGFLVEHNGKLVTCPSTSPENEFYAFGGIYACTYGSTCDISIIRDLFQNCIKAQEVLGHDETYSKICESLSKLPEYSIGKHGQLMEWQEDFEETEVNHRHLSHLYGFFPAYVIPDSFEDAIITTMERRGDKASAWEASWRAAIWARLRNGERAFKILSQQLTAGSPVNDVGANGGSMINLLDNYPPFQIDGAFGFPTAVAEMLVQTHKGKIDLLPAVPKALSSGSVSGLLLRGGIYLSMSWENGKVISAELLSKENQVVTLSVNNQERTVSLPSEKPVRITA